MEGFTVASIVYLGIVIGLIALFVVSFTLFIRRLLINSSVKSIQTDEIEKKLDKIISLLERDKNS
ncbi:DUF4083 domain-containing protein [Ammoniphilus resinae]|uniref:DUF4083 domain-containing protein n=1 Tax=Ammoniphilus resinae TaxID=861532 RepID=A0ABS4GP28_9BACL|nr:DUF4083 domain-containing protein [Ammoniphilus resinae]MBP1931981.1 hypothetical protein [Ammoniphilus resinae]